MILQALNELAESEQLSADLDFESVPVAWHIELREDGTLLGIRSRIEWVTPEGKKKPVRKAPVEKIPARAGRTSGVASQLLVDNAQYVFGLTPPDKPANAKRAAQCRDAFRQSVAACAEATGDEGARAVVLFLQAVAEGKVNIAWNEEWQANDLFSFILSSDIDTPVHLREKLKAYWRAQRKEDAAKKGAARQCLVTGKRMGDPPLFPLIKRVPSGTPSGVGLVSFNFAAVESQGWKGNENAAVSRDAAESCATALNRLLHPAWPDPKEQGNTLPKRYYRVTSDTAVVFWAPKAKEQVWLNQVGALIEVDKDALFRDDDARPTGDADARVRANFQGIWKGRSPDIADASPFYLMAITGAQGRAIVRDWAVTTVEKAFDHMAEYFKALDIVRNAPPKKGSNHLPNFPLPLLRDALGVRGDAGEQLKTLTADLFRCIVLGQRFPKSLLARALTRARAEFGRNEWKDLQMKDARAALVKAYLIRNAGKDIPKELNMDNNEPAYLLGALLALLEKTQTEALGDVNATIVDRYFKRVTTSPGMVMPRLLKINQSHMKKLKRDKPGLYITRVRQIDGIVAKFEAMWPQSLNLEEQGLFLLGYHQRRHELWKKRESEETGTGSAA